MVDLVLTDEQGQVAGSVASFLDSELPLERLAGKGRASSATDHARWKQMAELGWFGMGLGEVDGGVGYSAVEEALMFRQLGRHLVTPSAMAASLAARVALAAGDRDLADGIIVGDLRPAIAIPIGPLAVGQRVTGKAQVMDGEGASHVLFVTPENAALVEKRTLNDPKPSRSADDALSLEVGDLSAAPAVAVAGAEAQVHRHALLYCAASLAGICERTTEMAAAYAKVRETFGSPIGKYQAIKHKCADMAIRTDAVNALVAFASVTVRDRRPDADFQVTAAKLLATQYALLNAKENIQVHGAIGFTTELPAHLFLKRAHVLDQFAGAVRRQQMALLAQPAAQ